MNGVVEKFCIGNVDLFVKFQVWVVIVLYILCNLLYHWTHLELKRYFGIDELLDEESAARIWKKANAQLATSELTTQGILKKFNVTHLYTTNDPTDDLKVLEQLWLEKLSPFGTRGYNAKPKVR